MALGHSTSEKWFVSEGAASRGGKSESFSRRSRGGPGDRPWRGRRSVDVHPLVHGRSRSAGAGLPFGVCALDPAGYKVYWHRYSNGVNNCPGQGVSCINAGCTLLDSVHLGRVGGRMDPRPPDCTMTHTTARVLILSRHLFSLDTDRPWRKRELLKHLVPV